MKVVVDASNVAHYVKNENGQPKMSNILAAVKALEESEDEFVIIADASLRHDIDDKEKFLKLLESDNVEEVPAGNDADHFILDIATREKAKVLSTGSFLLAHDELDLRGLEQLVDREQTAALAQILKYMELHLIDGRTPFEEIVNRMLALIDSRGLEELFDGSTVRCGLAGVRKAEIAGMLNRYRKL